MTRDAGSKGKRLLWWLIAIALPALVVFTTNYLFVRNHFYTRAPYLHDSGWFSWIVYRRGLMPDNPLRVANDVVYYWGWHVTPLVSSASALSYLYPGDRVDWYCLFQGAIYAPLAFAVPLFVPREKRSSLALAVVVAATSLVFAFGGQVLACSGYPHFEIFCSAGLAILLAALATGRTRLAWIGIAMCLATREDGGVHAGFLLIAVIASGIFKMPFPVARRSLVIMTAVAFGGTVVGMMIQKRFFVGPDAWGVYLAGRPAYAHINSAVVVQRIHNVFEKSGFVWFPIVATALIAVVRRDARYLFGFIVGIPWLLLNFFAKQELKSTFEVYTGFPFVGCAFWVAAYACVADRDAREKDRATSIFVSLAIVSLASFAGLSYSYPHATRAILDSMTSVPDVDARAMRSYMGVLRSNPEAYGRVVSDSGVASWTLESASRAGVINDGLYELDFKTYDGVTFFRIGGMENVHNTLFAGRYTECGDLPRTPIVFCGRAGTKLPPSFKPYSYLTRSLGAAPFVTRNGDAFVVPSRPTVDIAVFGPYVTLNAGTYKARVDLAPAKTCAADSFIRVDINIVGVWKILAERDVHPGDGPVELTFTIDPPGPTKAVELRTFTSACAYTLERAEIERVPPAQ